MWKRSAASRRYLVGAAIVVACFVWAMVFVGLAFAMVDRGVAQWWLPLVFGLLVLAAALVAVRMVTSRIPTPEPGPGQGSGAVASSATTAPRPLVEPLSKRELEVLEQLAAGRSNREIAAALYVAPGTVKAHLNHIFRKLAAESRLQAVAHARQAGLLDPPGPQ